MTDNLDQLAGQMVALFRQAVALAKDDDPLLGDFANESDQDLVW